MRNSQKKIQLSPRLKFGVGRGYSQNRIMKIGSAVFLVIALGLTVNSFRLVFSGKGGGSASQAVPQVLGASDVKTKPANNGIQFEEYKIQKGDTLFNISQKYGISWTTIAALNNLKSPFTLKPGQTIKIPR